MVDDMHPAQSDSEPMDGWPSGVRPISLDGLDRLCVGNDGSIYWDGKQIEVRRSVELTWWQRIGAITVAGAAIIGASAACVSAYADLLMAAR